jgi:hypothetical protein
MTSNVAIFRDMTSFSMVDGYQYFGGICNLLFYPADGSNTVHPNLRYAPLNLHEVAYHNTLIFTIISCIICRELAIYRLSVLESLLQVVLLSDPAQCLVQVRVAVQMALDCLEATES